MTIHTDVQKVAKHVEAMCEGKHRFETWTEANRVPKRRRKRWKLGCTDIYRCPFCRGFHRGNGG